MDDKFFIPPVALMLDFGLTNAPKVEMPMLDPKLVSKATGIDVRVIKEMNRKRAIEEAKKEELEKLRLSEILDEDTLFRFAYVPFVIAEVAWDYADTVLNLTVIQKLKETLPLKRAVEKLRSEYNREHSRFIDEKHRQSEMDNMEVFQDEMKDLINQIYRSNVEEVRRLYPDLCDDSNMLVAEVYLCRIVLSALFRYAAQITKKIEGIVHHPIGQIVPRQMMKLYNLIEEFAGDSPIKEAYKSQSEKFVQSLVESISEVELNPIPTPKQ